MSIVCEEVFDETSHPSADDSEPQLLPLAAEGLMKALPPGWKPCLDDKSKSYYYYNNITGKTQWEHPLDDVYRGLVKKVRAESQSLSLGEPTEDATYARDEIPSYEEPPLSKKLDPIFLGAKKKDIKLSPLKTSPKHEARLLKQRSDDQILSSRKISLNIFNSFDEKIDANFDKHPRSLEKTELKITGGGSMFLKSNTKKLMDSTPSPAKSDSLDVQNQPRSILRERNSLEVSRSMDFDKISLDKSEKDDDDKKSVRFNLDNNTDVAFTFSDKSSSDDDLPDNIINVKISPNKPKSRFTVSPVKDFQPENEKKLIKPNPTDFIKPKLTISKGSDSEDDSIVKSMEKRESDGSEDSSLNTKMLIKTKRLEEKAEKKIAQLKQNIWEEKNDELVKFRDDLQESQKEELERILITAKTDHEDKIKAELENLRIEMENRNTGTLKEERLNYEKQLEEARIKLQTQIEEEERKIKEKLELKREELEKYYEEKLADVEKELAERMEKNRNEMITTHGSNIEQLKQNHSIILEELKKGFKAEEDVLRQEHKAVIAEIKNKIELETEKKSKEIGDERLYEKIRCEKRLLEDKYRCLKDKYLRLKTEVKMSIEKRNKRREQGGATTTTGSETERSHSNKKDRTPLNSPLRKPPTPKHNKISDPSKLKPEHRMTRQLIIQDLDTSISDKSENKCNKNEYDSSDNSTNPGRSRKKLFSRLKSSSTSRINNNTKSRRNQRSCSPVENLRRQLQKLEDLEDQFPQNPQADTYHLRYPFSDGQKFEGSSELEFFRHRIHLERDSIKRAKESLRNQKSLFQQRQKELKLKHGSMARHTLQQLCQEEKELTDMEVSLHRTRSLLGEKVIRLRHLEQSLQRATVTTENRHEDATLSDISSHSASSGISSTEFATADANIGKGLIQGEHLQESSEIIQSLENLNSEIREIWDVLRKQQQSGGIATVIPPLVYPDLGWPLLAGAATVPAPPSIPTLADRLHNYRQHVALANAQSTMVTHANQGATTTLVERTRNLRHWLRQAGIDNNIEGSTPQATL
ncbi:centrosomal protein of 164 kDa [Asbolus verrucosus]|uniref:Centrosomal protein of 164 kDa n=1 Tax=Asbolus verrucosus TaxID=1661398 RepID=A0A482WDR1_ASBVE|nr:centrosomal protein of 164 kDa [Asbolus verrucosus]